MTEKIDCFLFHTNVVYGETYIPSYVELNVNIHDMFNKIEEEKKLLNSLQQDFKRYTKLDVNKLMLEKIVFVEGL